MGEEKQLIAHWCPRCKKIQRVEINSLYREEVLDYRYNKNDIAHYVGDSAYELLKCTACDQIILQSYLYIGGGPDGVIRKVLYPVQPKPPVGLPPKVLREYKKAMEYRNTDAEIFAVKSGRILELIWIDFTAQLKEQGCQVAEIKELDEKIGKLTKYGIVPKNLEDVGRILKVFRNIGAHVEDYELSNEDLPILDDLLHAILLYVYSAPFIAKQAEERYDRLKGKSSKDDSDSKAPETS